MAAKQQVVKIVFQGDTALIKRAETEIRRETKVTQDQIRNEQNKTIKNLFDQTNKIKGHFSNLSNKTLGVLGLGFGLHGLVSSAGQFIGQIGRVGDELTGLSDQFGSVNKAVGIYYSGLGSSFASMGQVKSAMMELGNEGIKLDDNFKSLTFAVADFSQITGVSTGAIANLAGEIKGFGMATAKDMRNLLNDVVSIGLHGHQATLVIQTIGKAVENLAYFAGDGSKSIKALSKGISESTSFLTKMGVKAQTATTFMDKLTDPEQYGEMASLLNRINISQADYFNMLRTESGKENFFNKLQQNLPQIADQIMAINNPMAQREFAKSIGLPMEIAAKLAGKTKSEIQGIISKSMTDKKALEKKESQGKANQERFTEALEMFKMQALMPLMQFMVRNIPNFMKFVSLISQFVNKALSAATGYMDKFQGTVDKVFKDSNSLGELLSNAIGPLFDAFTTVVGDALAAFLSPKNWANIFSGFWNLFSKMPLWAQLLGGFMIFKRVGGFFTGLISGFKRGLTPATPMFVQNAGDAISGKGGILSKITGLFGGGGKAAAATGAAATGAATAGAGSIGGSMAALANPIGLIAAALAGVAYIGYKAYKAYDALEPLGKDYVDNLAKSGRMDEAKIQMIGHMIGTQETFLDGLTAQESYERKKLMLLKEQGKILPEQEKQLKSYNEKLQTTSITATDVFGSVLGKIASIFSSDGMLSAKITLALNNFGTWLGGKFNEMFTNIKSPLKAMESSNIATVDQINKSLDSVYSRVAAGTAGVGELKYELAKYKALSKTASNDYLKEIAANKAGELQARIGSLSQYEARKRNTEAAERAKQHAETTKLLGGIGASTAKTAENTSPAKDPVREAFKEIAITNAQMLETQYAGSNFASK